jgi:ribonuclease HI
MLYDDNMIEHDEYQIYTMWFNEFLDELKLGGIIYVNANPKTCFDRVKIRNREGENIPLEYLQKCHDYHESWLSCIENKLTIEANVDTSLSENKNKRTDWVETIDEWISNELYKNESQLKENNSNNYPILRFDGACRGNPSDVIGVGCLIYNDTSTLCQKSEHYFMPDKGTNNVAEYKALIDGLEMAKENSITKINIQGDSQLIINQMTGVYKVKAENLIPLYEKAKQLETYFDKINYSHIKREFNKAADKLANLALDNICSGCYPIYQPNQEGHMGINGCLSNDDD